MRWFEVFNSSNISNKGTHGVRSAIEMNFYPLIFSWLKMFLFRKGEVLMLFISFPSTSVGSFFSLVLCVTIRIFGLCLILEPWSRRAAFASLLV
ncbi:hypothetical protein P3X46_003188 [Hevea brasiliensis]|uniref:NADH:quinone oxidoreductase/Mrp antiporter membrane subunit domain-containing protein n=1 Tax=Hevea brasiliensis TaxID=3981 RepID=A0ABQ9N7N8_HEVBR|nr:hypothetical protein P3X46_003188 [Hevea brasiliensis]